MEPAAGEGTPLYPLISNYPSNLQKAIRDCPDLAAFYLREFEL